MHELHPLADALASLFIALACLALASHFVLKRTACVRVPVRKGGSDAA